MNWILAFAFAFLIVLYDAKPQQRIAEIFVINLTRRIDKWNSFVRRMHITQRVTRVAGVVPSFTHPHFVHGHLGCAMAHLKILERVLAKSGSDYYLILEDDAELTMDKYEIEMAISDCGSPIIHLGACGSPLPPTPFLRARTHAYAVTPMGARILHSHWKENLQKKNPLPIDLVWISVLMGRSWSKCLIDFNDKFTSDVATH
jgi:hypothetical protein